MQSTVSPSGNTGGWTQLFPTWPASSMVNRSWTRPSALPFRQSASSKQLRNSTQFARIVFCIAPGVRPRTDEPETEASDVGLSSQGHGTYVDWSRTRRPGPCCDSRTGAAKERDQHRPTARTHMAHRPRLRATVLQFGSRQVQRPVGQHVTDSPSTLDAS